MTTSPTLAPGELDPAFANAGRLVLSFPDFPITHGQCVTEGPDGKIYMLGGSWERNTQTAEHVSVTRLLQDGTLDFSFGTFGTAHVSCPMKTCPLHPSSFFL